MQYGGFGARLRRRSGSATIRPAFAYDPSAYYIGVQRLWRPNLAPARQS